MTLFTMIAGAVPVVAVLYIIFFLGNTTFATDEFYKLVQVPILKKDLNRILKVCATYNSIVASSFHNLVLKYKRPHEIDLVFQSSLAKMKFEREKTLRPATIVRIVFTILTVVNIFSGNSFALIAGSVLFVLFEAFLYYLKNALEYQVYVLFKLRNLLYANLEAPGFVPSKYRPKVLSQIDLEIYKNDVSAFNDFIEKKKAILGKSISKDEIHTLYDSYDEKSVVEDYKNIEDAL